MVTDLTIKEQIMDAKDDQKRDIVVEIVLEQAITEKKMSLANTSEIIFDRLLRLNKVSQG
jgi:hypothetical protein